MGRSITDPTPFLKNAYLAMLSGAVLATGPIIAPVVFPFAGREGVAEAPQRR